MSFLRSKRRAQQQNEFHLLSLTEAEIAICVNFIPTVEIVTARLCRVEELSQVLVYRFQTFSRRDSHIAGIL